MWGECEECEEWEECGRRVWDVTKGKHGGGDGTKGGRDEALYFCSFAVVTMAAEGKR